MPAKVFETLFKLHAKYLGKPAFQAANRDIDRTQRNLKETAAGFAAVRGMVGKATTALAGLVTAYKLAAAAAELWRKGFEAASEARDIQERLGVLAKQNAARWKMSASEIVASVNKVSERIAAVGFDTEDATVGVMKLTKAFTPKGLEHFGEAYMNIVAKLKGATPGAEGFADVAEQINQAILRGRPAVLAQLGFTDQQIKAFKKLSPMQREQLIFQHAQLNLSKEAQRVFDETTLGRIAKAAKAYEDLGQALTEDTVAQQGRMAAIQERISKALTPTAKKIGEIIGKLSSDTMDKIEERLKWFEEWLITNQPRINTTLSEAYENLKKINAVHESIFGWSVKIVLKWMEWSQKIMTMPFWIWGWLQKAGEPAQLPKLPGSPTGVNPALEQGEVGRRRRDAEERKVRDLTEQMGRGFPPYQRGYRGGVDSRDIRAAIPENQTIAQMRASRVAEIQNDPYMKQLFAATIAKEAGTPTGVQAVTESMFNRAQMRNQTIQQAIRSRFYGPVNRGEVDAMVRQGVPDWAMKQADVALAKVAAGSNLIEGRTDQGMINEIKGAKKQFGGEWFGYMPGTQKWSEEFNRKASLKGMTSALGPRAGAGGGTTNNLSMNSPITVNGVAPGKEYAVARSVRSAIRDPIRRGLDEMKKMQNFEDRLRYV